MMPMHIVTHLMVASVITSPTFWLLRFSLPQPPDSGKSNSSPVKRKEMSHQSAVMHLIKCQACIAADSTAEFYPAAHVAKSVFFLVSFSVLMEYCHEKYVY